MAHGWLTGEFHSHPKRGLVGVCVDGLLARAISRSAEHLTDGFVEASWCAQQLPVAAQRKRVLELCVRHRVLEPLASGESRRVTAPARTGLRTKPCEVTVGPFEVDGYLVHDFLDYNRARAEVEERRERERRKKAGQRAAGTQGAFAWAGPNGGVPAGQSSLSPGLSPASIEAGLDNDLPSTTESSGQSDARTPELARKVKAVVAVLGQCTRLHVDVVAVENAIAAFPTADPVVAARGVVASASDPAFRWTNGARLLFTELERSTKPAAQRRGRAGRTTADDFLALKGATA